MSVLDMLSSGRLLRLLLILAIAKLLFSSAVYAGAWTQSAKHGFYKIGFRWISANEFYEPGGNEIPINTLNNYSASIYGEFGLNDWLTVLGNIPFYERSTLDQIVEPGSGFVFFPGDSNAGIADFIAGARVGLIRNRPIVLSASIQFGLPVGEEVQENGLVTGDGEFNQFFSFLIGHSFHPHPFYATGELGINNRSNGYSDELQYLVEFGYSFGRRYTLVGRIRGVESLKNGEEAVTGGTSGLYANNQSFLTYGTEFVVDINGKSGIDQCPSCFYGKQPPHPFHLSRPGRYIPFFREGF